jgi:hypothetical protein
MKKRHENTKHLERKSSAGKFFLSRSIFNATDGYLVRNKIITIFANTSTYFEIYFILAKSPVSINGSKKSGEVIKKIPIVHIHPINFPNKVFGFAGNLILISNDIRKPCNKKKSKFLPDHLLDINHIAYSCIQPDNAKATKPFTVLLIGLIGSISFGITIKDIKCNDDLIRLFQRYDQKSRILVEAKGNEGNTGFMGTFDSKL